MPYDPSTNRLVKYVTCNKSGNWFSMHETQGEAIENVKNDSTGISDRVELWSYERKEDGDKLTYKKLLWTREEQTNP